MSRTRPLFVRPLTDAERQVLQESLRAADAFVLRRAQIILASAAGERSSQIAARVGFTSQGVRDVIHAFNARGLAALQPGSHHPGVVVSAFDTPRALALRDLLHQSPRSFGKDTSLWTLELAATVAYEQGLTAQRVSGVTIRNTLARMGVRWRRAKEWITSPDPEYARKKAARDRLIRLAHPALHAWQADDQPYRLVEQTVARDDLDPKAVACYGLLTRTWDEQGARTDALWLRFVDGRPVSAVTIDFLTWCAARAAERGKRALLLVWDNASWHESQIVRRWLRAYNRAVKQTGTGVRLLVCFLPVKSPWLNPIEPRWLHSKRKVHEPERLLTLAELVERVCAVLDCPHEPHLVAPLKTTKKAA